MLLAVDGYFIGFARIVQYQSVVFLTSVLVVWLLVRTLRMPSLAGRSLPTAAFLLGAGLLSHYEAGLVVFPALIFIAEGLGADLSGQLEESFTEAQAASDTEQDRLSLPVAALFSGFAAFFVGLFVLSSPIFVPVFGIETELIVGLFASIESAFWLIAVVYAKLSFPALSFNIMLTGISESEALSVFPSTTV